MSLRRGCGSDCFSEAADNTDFFETGCQVIAAAGFVINLGIGGQFGASLIAGPFFGGGHEGLSKASPAKSGIDIPSFEEGDAFGQAADSGGPQGQFGHSDKAVIFFGHEDRQRFIQRSGEENYRLDQ